jgi:hypothetical protein
LSNRTNFNSPNFSNDYDFNTTDMETLDALAWDCPFDKGPAVFAARALMQKLNHRTSLYKCVRNGANG